MSKSLKRKLIFAIIAFGLGAISTFIGALFKLQHWPGAGLSLTLGTILNVIAVIMFLVFLISYIKNKKT